MHDIRSIRDNPDHLIDALMRRQQEPEAVRKLVADLIALDDRRRAAIAAAQEKQEKRNALSKEIGEAMKAKDAARAEALKAEVAALKEDVPRLEAEEKAALAALDEQLAAIPNTPLAEVPDGKDEHDNIEKSRYGAPRELPFQPKQHFELGEASGEMDFEAAVKLSGARFVVLKSGLARLSRALGQFMLDTHTLEHGYTEVNPPILVRDDAMFGTAQLPKFHDDQFGILDGLTLSLVEDRLDLTKQGSAEDPAFISKISAETGDWLKKAKRWLIPTAEVPLTNLVRESILSEDELPLRLTALTPCFRAEAGSAGRDTRGMIRQHQFEKVELVSITTPDKSAEEHERMLACAEAILKKLDLHYRVVTLCTGDMGFASQKTYDIEVWLPGAPREDGGFGLFREISSCSVCGDFQARRMNARYRPAGEKGTRFLHTLNGSGVAVGRALIAVMETYQNEDGSISVPDALKPYLRGTERIGGRA